MRYQYKVKQVMWSDLPMWRAYCRICWPFPWFKLYHGLTIAKEWSVEQCHKHAARRNTTPGHITIIPMPPAF